VAQDIRQRIVLEGEKEYNSAIREAQRNLKTLRSELKAETAELGNNATAQQKNQTKAKNLQRQIAEQEKAVKAYTDALAEVKEKYGDNEEAVAKYEQKLNDARTALANLKNQLDAVSNSYDNINSGAKQGIVENNALAESFGRIAEAAGSMGTKIEDVFKGVLGSIKNVGKAIWGELAEIAAMSDNYEDLASYFGSSATEVQKWDSAMRAAGGDLSTVTSLITKLKYSGKDDKLAEWFQISPENYENDLEFFQMIMNRMTEMRATMSKSDWNQAMTDIFGSKKGLDVEGILSDWNDIKEGLKTFDADEGGYGLTEDEIQKMADYNVQVNTLRESWQKLKEMATVHLFGDLAIRVTGNLQNIVDAFRDYLSADNPYAKKQALDTIKQNVKEMFIAIRDAIKAGLEVLDELATEFENSDDKASQTIGGLLRGIKNIIEWLADPEHWEAIKAGIEIVLGVWLFSKLARLTTTLTSVYTSLKGIWAMKGVSTVTSAITGGGAAVATGGTGAVATGGTAAKAGFGAKLAAMNSSVAAATGVSLAGMTGGLAVIAAGVYGISELVNSVNEKAQKAREVTRDEERYANLSDDQKAYLQSAVRAIQHETGGSAKVAPMLQQLAGELGPELLSAFEYTNTSGEKRNKLLDMLDMDNESAAIAAMMIQAAGIDTSGMGTSYSNALGLWNEYQKAGKKDFTGAYNTLAGLGGFWDLSGTYVNGKFTIPGYENYKRAMSGEVNTAPNPWELSGYANTTNKPAYINGLMWYNRPELQSVWGANGTWDPSLHTSDWWKTQGGIKADMSETAIAGIKQAVTSGISNIRVYLDGEEVGRLVTPRVSEGIARMVQ